MFLAKLLARTLGSKVKTRCPRRKTLSAVFVLFCQCDNTIEDDSIQANLVSGSPCLLVRFFWKQLGSGVFSRTSHLFHGEESEIRLVENAPFWRLSRWMSKISELESSHQAACMEVGGKIWTPALRIAPKPPSAVYLSKDTRHPHVPFGTCAAPSTSKLNVSAKYTFIQDK